MQVVRPEAVRKDRTLLVASRTQELGCHDGDDLGISEQGPAPTRSRRQEISEETEVAEPRQS
jgi:hypothetical protein